MKENDHKGSLQASDVTRVKSITTLAHALGGRAIDLLTLNSAVYTRKGNKIGEIDYDAWREANETNLMGAVRVAEALLENVAASKGKQIATISTAMGSMQPLNSTIVFGAVYQYRTSKAALNMAMSILAKELEPRRISVVIFA